MIPELIDIGANLTHDSFDADREEVIQRAEHAGVKRMIITGASEKGSEDAASLAASRPGQFYATAGVHPHHASEYSNSVHSILESLLTREEVVAVGECGLDYFRNFSPKNAQCHAFERQLHLAIESQLPVFLHQRDAHADFVSLLQPKREEITRAVAHCFTGTEKELRDYIEMDLYIGITGWICDERRGAHLKDIVSLIPPERLMLETDAPYLLPRTLKPKPKSRRNEPAHLSEVLRVVAATLDMSEIQLAAQTTSNAETFFGL